MEEERKRKLTNDELAVLFGREEWDGPITLLTRKDLAKELGVSERTLRRWEDRGIIQKPFNSVLGAGRGNHAVYSDPLEGVVSVLNKGSDVYVIYINGRVRWRKKRDNNGIVSEEDKETDI